MPHTRRHSRSIRLSLLTLIYAALFYAATAMLVVGTALKIRSYARTPAPLKIPTTPAPTTTQSTTSDSKQKVLPGLGGQTTNCVRAGMVAQPVRPPYASRRRVSAMRDKNRRTAGPARPYLP